LAQVQPTVAKSCSVREAEDLLRQAAGTAQDPFVALTQSFQRKGRKQALPLALEDEEER